MFGVTEETLDLARRAHKVFREEMVECLELNSLDDLPGGDFDDLPSHVRYSFVAAIEFVLKEKHP